MVWIVLQQTIRQKFADDDYQFRYPLGIEQVKTETSVFDNKESAIKQAFEWSNLPHREYNKNGFYETDETEFSSRKKIECKVVMPLKKHSTSLYGQISSVVK